MRRLVSWTPSIWIPVGTFVGNGWYTKLVGGVRSHDDFTVSRVGNADITRPCAPNPRQAIASRRKRRSWRGSQSKSSPAGPASTSTSPTACCSSWKAGLRTWPVPCFRRGSGAFSSSMCSAVGARRLDVRPVQRAGSYTGRNSQGNSRSARAPISPTRRDGCRSRDKPISRRPGVGSASSSERPPQWNASIRSTKQRGARLCCSRRSTAINKLFSAKPIGTSRTAQARACRARRSQLAARVAVFAQGSLVYSIDANHSLRFTYNEAFQVPNYSELFLQADAAPPVNLGASERLVPPFGATCGFERTRVLALGNADLELEKTKAWEIGYKGILAGRAFVTIDFYRSGHPTSSPT